MLPAIGSVDQLFLFRLHQTSIADDLIAIVQDDSNRTRDRIKAATQLASIGHEPGIPAILNALDLRKSRFVTDPFTQPAPMRVALCTFGKPAGREIAKRLLDCEYCRNHASLVREMNICLQNDAVREGAVEYIVASEAIYRKLNEAYLRSRYSAQWETQWDGHYLRVCKLVKHNDD